MAFAGWCICGMAASVQSVRHKWAVLNAPGIVVLDCIYFYFQMLMWCFVIAEWLEVMEGPLTYYRICNCQWSCLPKLFLYHLLDPSVLYFLYDFTLNLQMCSLIIYIILQHTGGAAAQQFSSLLENFLMPCLECLPLVFFDVIFGSFGKRYWSLWYA